MPGTEQMPSVAPRGTSRKQPGSALLPPAQVPVLVCLFAFYLWTADSPYDDRAFDAEAWGKGTAPSRKSMTQSLLRDRLRPGAPVAEVIALLGPGVQGGPVRLTPAATASTASTNAGEAVVSTMPSAGLARASSLLTYKLGDDIFGRGRSHHYSYLVLYFDHDGRYIGGEVNAG